MTYRTFGTGTPDTVTDHAGNVLAGVDLTIWTAPDGAGTKITSLQDLDGNPLTDKVTTDASGYFPFRANTELRLLWAKTPAGEYRSVFCSEVFGEIGNIADVGDIGGLVNSLGEVARSLSQFATAGQLDGSKEANSALQAAVDSGANRIMVPPGSTLLHNGTSILVGQGRQNIRIDGQGSTIRRTDRNGSYVVFLARGGGLGYGASVQNLVIENFKIEGNVATDINVCLLGANHAKNVIIRNVEFWHCMVQGGHTMDLGGCDGILIDNCRWYGCKYTGGATAPRTEAINTDVSVNGSGADLPPYLDGLSTRNVTLQRSGFYPWTDPNTGTIYPAPTPMGAHLAREGQPFRNIRVSDVMIVDPAVDPNTTTNLTDDNPYLRGLFHWPAVRGLKIDATVIATNGLGCTRIVQVSSTSYGSTAATDPNTGGQANFAVPDPAVDIDIDLRVEGMKGTQSTLNPLVAVTGLAAAPAKDVMINISADGATDGIYLRNVDTAKIDGQLRSTTRPTSITSTTGLAWGPSLGCRQARLTVDKIVNNTVTLTATGLAVPVDANAVYQLSAFVITNSTQTADLRFGFTSPAGSTMQWISDGFYTSSTGTQGSIYRSVLAASGVAPVGGAGTSDIAASPLGLLTIGSTGGTFTFTFAQYLAEVSDTIIRAGSWLRLDRIV